MEATAPVTVEQAAAILGVSPSTVHRRIRSGGLRAEQAQRPQGTVWLVDLPAGTVEAAADLSPPTAPEATAPTTAVSATPQADAMVSLIQTTIAAVLGPLVGQLDAHRQTVERQAGELANLREDRGRLTAELEAAAGETITLKVRESKLLAELDTLKAAQTPVAAQPAAEPMPAPSEPPMPLWPLVLALVAVVLFFALLAWRR